MKKSSPFAVFDIDGTLIRWQLYHSLVDQLGKQGALPASDVEKIKQSRMNWKERRHSDTFSDYQSMLVQVFHENLASLPPNEFDTAVDVVFERYKNQVYTYTRDLIGTLREQGYALFVVSGSHHEIITKLATYYGFDEAIGNKYERTDGSFTGNHQYVVANKVKLLHELVEKHGLSYKDSLAIGDSASDASLLDTVTNPIAFNPDKTLYKIALEKSWPIVIERKNVIYHLKEQDGNYQLLPPN